MDWFNPKQNSKSLDNGTFSTLVPKLFKGSQLIKNSLVTSLVALALSVTSVSAQEANSAHTQANQSAAPANSAAQDSVSMTDSIAALNHADFSIANSGEAKGTAADGSYIDLGNNQNKNTQAANDPGNLDKIFADLKANSNALIENAKLNRNTLQNGDNLELRDNPPAEEDFSSSNELDKIINSGKNNLSSFGSYSDKVAANNANPFTPSYQVIGNNVLITLKMAGHSYIYQHSLMVQSNDKELYFTDLVLPPAQSNQDALGTSMVYFNELNLVVPIIKAAKGDTLTLNYQGCDAAGICYPPAKFDLTLENDLNATTIAAAIASAKQLSQQTQKALENRLYEEKMAHNTKKDSAKSKYLEADVVSGAKVYDDLDMEANTALASSKKAQSSNGNLEPFALTQEQLDALRAQGVTTVESINQNSSSMPRTLKQEHAQSHEKPIDGQNAEDAEQDLSLFGYLALTVGQGDEISKLLGNNLLIGILLCFFLGIGLDLTPCVLPMLPIFSAMLIGTNTDSTAKVRMADPSVDKAKLLSIGRLKFLVWQNLGYAIGLSLTYTLLGVLFSLAGASMHGLLQSPVVTYVIAILLLICALASAGVIELKLPAAFTNKIQSKISVLQTQRFSGAFLLGALSALIASPCTSAPLAGALLYVMQNGNLFLGAIVFFAIGVGMATPLFIIGLFGAKFLQRSSVVGNVVKRIMVVVLIITAYYITRHLLGRAEILIGSLMFYVCCVYTILSIYSFFSKEATTLVAGVVAATIALVPTYYSFEYFEEVQSNRTYTDFFTASSNTSLHRLTDGHQAYVVLTADWCANCKFMEKSIYSKEPFLSATSDMRRVVINITDTSNPEITELLRTYSVIGVPFFMTLDEHGHVVHTELGLVNQNVVMRAVDELKTHIQDHALNHEDEDALDHNEAQSKLKSLLDFQSLSNEQS